MKTKSPKQGNMLMLLFSTYLIAMPLLINAIGLMPESLFGQGLIGQVAGLFLPFLVYLLITRQKPAEVLALKAPSKKQVCIAIVIGISAVPIIVTSSMLIPIISSFIFPNMNVIAVDFAHAAPSIVTLLLVGAVFPALFEEILFRGVFLNYYPIKKAAFITALFFGLIHGNIVQLIYAVPFGMLYVFLVYFTGSIWVPIIAHFFANALSFLLAFGAPTSPYESAQYLYEAVQTTNDSTMIMIFLFAVISLAMLPIIFLCMKQLEKDFFATKASIEIIPPIPNQKTYTWHFWLVLLLWTIITLLQGFAILSF